MVQSKLVHGYSVVTLGDTHDEHSSAIESMPYGLHCMPGETQETYEVDVTSLDTSFPRHPHHHNQRYEAPQDMLLFLNTLSITYISINLHIQLDTPRMYWPEH